MTVVRKITCLFDSCRQMQASKTTISCLWLLNHKNNFNFLHRFFRSIFSRFVFCVVYFLHMSNNVSWRVPRCAFQEDNGSYSVKVEGKFLSRIQIRECMTHILGRQQCMRSVYYSYTLLQKKCWVSNRSQVLLILHSLLYAGIFIKDEMRKNNLLSAVTRRRFRRFMYISENIYRLNIFILCVFFRSRIKISVNNKLYMKQICHMSPERPIESR